MLLFPSCLCITLLPLQTSSGRRTAPEGANRRETQHLDPNIQTLKKKKSETRRNGHLWFNELSCSPFLPCNWFVPSSPLSFNDGLNVLQTHEVIAANVRVHAALSRTIIPQRSHFHTAASVLEPWGRSL